MNLYADETDPGIMILEADAELDETTTTELVERVETLVEGGLRRIIVDCSRVEHVSSHGLGVLIRIHHRMRSHGGNVKITGVKGLMAQALHMTQLDRVFDIYPELEAARAAFPRV